MNMNLAFVILHKNGCYSIFAKSLNNHTARFKQGKICSLSILIIYSRYLMGTRKKQVIDLSSENCEKLFGE